MGFRFSLSGSSSPGELSISKEGVTLASGELSPLVCFFLSHFSSFWGSLSVPAGG